MSDEDLCEVRKYIKSKEINEAIENLCSLVMRNDDLILADIINAVNNYDTNIKKFVLYHNGLISYFKYVVTEVNLIRRMNSLTNYLRDSANMLYELAEKQFDNVEIIKKFIIILNSYYTTISPSHEKLNEISFTFDFAYIMGVMNFNLNLIRLLYKKVINEEPTNIILSSIRELTTYSEQFIEYYDE